MKRLLKWFIEHNFKVWGVGFETDLPPEIVVSEHAEQRLMQRMGVKKEKIPKLAVKAWASKNLLPADVEKTKNYREYFYGKKDLKGKVYKELMGYVFVFRYTEPRRPFEAQKVLITVW